MELTKKEFLEAISKANNEGKKFNIESEDSSSVYLSLYGCTIETSEEDGIEGEITFFKPHTAMEIRLDFAIIDAIYKESDGYRLEFNNAMPSVDLMESKSE